MKTLSIAILCAVVLGVAMLWIPAGPALPPGLTFAQSNQTNFGSSTSLAAPGPIGGTTPSTGAFTTLSATSLALSDTAANADLTLTNTTAATTGASKSSPIFQLSNNVFNVSSLPDTWAIQNICGTGNAPVCALTFTHTGTGAGFAKSAFLDQVAFGSGAQTTISNVGTINTSAAINSTGGIFSTASYRTNSNCAVNSVSPAACGTAPSGGFVVPTTTTTYTVNTGAVTADSRVFIQPITFASDLPSSPTCVAPATTSIPVVSAMSTGVSFTITITSTTGQTCWWYDIRN